MIASPLAGVRVDTEPAVPITIAADEPDKVAGITYEPGTTAKRLAEVGCAVSGTDPLTVTPRRGVPTCANVPTSSRRCCAWRVWS